MGKERWKRTEPRSGSRRVAFHFAPAFIQRNKVSQGRERAAAQAATVFALLKSLAPAHRDKLT